MLASTVRAPDSTVPTIPIDFCCELSLVGAIQNFVQKSLQRPLLYVYHYPWLPGHQLKCNIYDTMQCEAYWSLIANLYTYRWTNAVMALPTKGMWRKETLRTFPDQQPAIIYSRAHIPPTGKARPQKPICGGHDRLFVQANRKSSHPGRECKVYGLHLSRSHRTIQSTRQFLNLHCPAICNRIPRNPSYCFGFSHLWIMIYHSRQMGRLKEINRP